MAPTLFITAESRPTVTMTISVSQAALWPATHCRPAAMRCATPARTSPWLRMNMATTVSTAGLANPASACSTLRRP